MSQPLTPQRNVEVELARISTEATRIRAEAGKVIVATLLRGVVPLAIFGIAVGATDVAIRQVDPSLHLAALLVIWLSATVVSALAIVGGVLETQRWQWKRPSGEPALQLDVNESKRLFHSIQE